MSDIKEWLRSARHREDVEWYCENYTGNELQEKLDSLSYDDNDLYYFLEESDVVYESESSHRRHWSEFSVVVKIEDKYVHFTKATTTTDYTAKECGWQFNWNDCYFVEPVEVVAIEYRRVEN